MKRIISIILILVLISMLGTTALANDNKTPIDERLDKMTEGMDLLVKASNTGDKVKNAGEIMAKLELYNTYPQYTKIMEKSLLFQFLQKASESNKSWTKVRWKKPGSTSIITIDAQAALRDINSLYGNEFIVKHYPTEGKNGYILTYLDQVNVPQQLDLKKITKVTELNEGYVFGVNQKNDLTRLAGLSGSYWLGAKLELMNGSKFSGQQAVIDCLSLTTSACARSNQTYQLIFLPEKRKKDSEIEQILLREVPRNYYENSPTGRNTSILGIRKVTFKNGAMGTLDVTSNNNNILKGTFSISPVGVRDINGTVNGNVISIKTKYKSLQQLQIAMNSVKIPDDKRVQALNNLFNSNDPDFYTELKFTLDPTKSLVGGQSIGFEVKFNKDYTIKDVIRGKSELVEVSIN